MNPYTYRLLVLEHALRFYARTGKPVNTSYTSRNMMQVAERLTGKTFKPRDFLGAADTLKKRRAELQELEAKNARSQNG
jgi:hypothetical protein